MTSHADPKLSVVIPAYNEEKRIATALSRVSAYLSLVSMAWEVLPVNDGSKDGTSLVIERFMKDHPKVPVRPLTYSPNHGKGFAVREGCLQARGHYVLITDADMSSPIKEVEKLLKALDGGAGVAIGSRALRSPGCDVRQSFKRHVSGRIFNAITQTLILPGIQDSQCGFKCFTREAAQRLFSAQKLDGFSFDVEILYLARKFGIPIVEVPVMWSEGEGSKVNLLRDSTRMVADLLRIKKLHS